MQHVDVMPAERLSALGYTSPSSPSAKELSHPPVHGFGFFGLSGAPVISGLVSKGARSNQIPPQDPQWYRRAPGSIRMLKSVACKA